MRGRYLDVSVQYFPMSPAPRTNPSRPPPLPLPFLPARPAALSRSCPKPPPLFPPPLLPQLFGASSGDDHSGEAGLNSASRTNVTPPPKSNWSNAFNIQIILEEFSYKLRDGKEKYVKGRSWTWSVVIDNFKLELLTYALASEIGFPSNQLSFWYVDKVSGKCVQLSHDKKQHSLLFEMYAAEMTVALHVEVRDVTGSTESNGAEECVPISVVAADDPFVMGTQNCPNNVQHAPTQPAAAPIAESAASEVGSTSQPNAGHADQPQEPENPSTNPFDNIPNFSHLCCHLRNPASKVRDEQVAMTEMINLDCDFCAKNLEDIKMATQGCAAEKLPDLLKKNPGEGSKSARTKLEAEIKLQPKLNACEGERATWDEDQTASLIFIMKELVEKFTGKQRWSKEGWNRMTKRLDDQYPGVFSKQQVKNKEKRLMQDHNVVSSILKVSGFCWSRDKGKVTAVAKDCWDTLTKEKKWKCKAFPHYDVVHEIYEGKAKRKHCKRAPTLSAPVSSMPAYDLNQYLYGHDLPYCGCTPQASNAHQFSAVEGLTYVESPRNKRLRDSKESDGGSEKTKAENGKETVLRNVVSVREETKTKSIDSCGMPQLTELTKVNGPFTVSNDHISCVVSCIQKLTRLGLQPLELSKIIDHLSSDRLRCIKFMSAVDGDCAEIIEQVLKPQKESSETAALKIS